MGVLRMVYLQILGDFCNLVWCFCKIGFWKMRVKALSEPPYWETSVFSTFTFFSGLFVSHDSNIFLETNSILKILRVTNFRFCCVITVHIFFHNKCYLYWSGYVIQNVQFFASWKCRMSNLIFSSWHCIYVWNE